MQNTKKRTAEAESGIMNDEELKLNMDIRDFQEPLERDLEFREKRFQRIKDIEYSENRQRHYEKLISNLTGDKRMNLYGTKKTAGKEPAEKEIRKTDNWKSLLKFFSDFTGIWITLIMMIVYRGLLFLSGKGGKGNFFLDVACWLPTMGISVENLKNFICGEREFSPLSVFDLTKREERQMPVVERKQLRPAPPYELRLDGTPGFYYGRYGMNKIGKPQKMDGHIIIIGAPGSGKTSALAIPSLSTWTGGLFAIDIKGELLEKSGDAPNNLVFDPSNEVTYGYDPFLMLQNAGADDFSHALNDILMAIIPDKHTDDPFWDISARRYLAGAYTWAFYENYDFIQINEIIYKTPAPALIEDIMDSGCEAAKAHMGHFLETSDKTLSSIIQNVLNAIELFATDPAVQRTLLRKEVIDPTMLLQGNRIFLEIPEDRIENWRVLLCMIVNQFFRGMMRYPDYGKQRVLVMLDEFPRLGKISSITDGMATLRSKGCTICLIMQSYSQLDKVYGDKVRKIITDNAAYKVVLSAMDPATAEEISKMVGQYYRTEVTKNQKGILGLRGESSGTSKRLAYLIRPEQLQNLGNELLLLTPNGFCRLQKSYYFKER